ncbi:DNA circularization N-terminal domain-containing protein, partial [Shigella sonnei]|nr:DNA circularization N-terminal domain-containing protein [Shigella sonnei]
MASTDTPGRGSFRGVPFLVYQEQRERGGRNIVRREYPLRESGGGYLRGTKVRSPPSWFFRGRGDGGGGT